MNPFILEKEKKLFLRTRQRWEQADSQDRLRCCLAGQFKEDEYTKRVETLYDQGKPLDCTESLLSDVTSESMKFSQFTMQELDGDDSYESLSFMKKYEKLREKWEKMSSEEKDSFNMAKT